MYEKYSHLPIDLKPWNPINMWLQGIARVCTVLIVDFKELLEVPEKRMSKGETPTLNKRSSTGDLESKTPKSEKKEKRDKKKFYTLGKHNVFNYIGGKILSKMPSTSNLGNRSVKSDIFHVRKIV